jgi:8-hydroxy-5-deazaflavin:NADPH oxidoreductase
MSIAIIGAGAIGTALARQFARNGIDAQIANSRGPATLAALVAELGPRITAVSARQAAQADIVILAVNWNRLPQAVQDLGPWNGRIVVDANNAVEVPSFRAVELHGRPSTAVLADLLPGARVVKAFNHLAADLLGSDPAVNGGRRVLFLSGDEASSKAEVAALIERIGYAPVDLGSVQEGRAAQFPGGALPILHLVKFD